MLEYANTALRTLRTGKFHIAIMSANRFFCAGVAAIGQQQPLASVQLHFCHTLRELQSLLKSQFIQGVLMEEFGEGENMMDWLPFRHFLSTSLPTLTVMMLLPVSRIRSHRQNPGWISTKAPLSDLRLGLKKMASGGLRGQYMTDWGLALTSKEWLILRLLCEGVKPVAISHKLQLSQKTISAHKRSALRKLDVTALSLLIMRYNGIFQQTMKERVDDVLLAAESKVA